MDSPAEPERSNRFWTIPNVLCLIRLVGSVLLLLIAYQGARTGFLGLLVFLLLTDWLDGKLAINLNQRTVIGARLDSLADAAMYGALFLGTWLLLPDLVWRELVWLLVAGASYLLTTGAGLLKFGKAPSYHTYGAKLSWLLICIGVFSAYAGWANWPLRLALVAVTLTNLEATAITCVLPQWRADVLSLPAALKLRRAERSDG